MHSENMSEKNYFVASILLAFIQTSLGLFGVFVSIAITGNMSPMLFSLMRGLISLPPTIMTAYIIDGNEYTNKDQSRRHRLSDFLTVSPQWRSTVGSLRIWRKTAVVLGMMCISPAQLSISFAIAWSSPLTMALFGQTVPLIASSISMARKLEPFSLIKVAGTIVSFTGCSLMILNPFDSEKSADLTVSLQGMAMIALNVVASVLYLFMQKRFFDAEKVPASTTTAMSFCGSTFVLCIASLVYFIFIDPNNQPTQSLADAKPVVVGAMLYAGFVASCASFVAGNYAMKLSDPSFSSMFTPLSPIATALFSFCFFSSLPTVSQYVGGSFIVCGLTAVLIQRRREFLASQATEVVPTSKETKLGEVGNSHHEHELAIDRISLLQVDADVHIDADPQAD
eukprot:ANDGO_04930.mRNA.1 DUF6 domain-containing protein